MTQFQGGTAPDIIHDESADIMGFANQGYLADLSKYLDADVKKQVSKDVWSSVTTPDGKIVAAPTLLQSYVVFANTDALKAAGAAVPTARRSAGTTSRRCPRSSPPEATSAPDGA